MKTKGTYRMMLVISILISIYFVDTPAAERGLSSVRILAKAKKYFDQLDYDKAKKLCQQGIRFKNNPKSILEQFYLLLGMIDAAMGNTKSAEKYFVTLLYINPKFRLSDDISPKIREVFNSAKKIYKKESPFFMEIKVERPMPDNTVPIRLYLNDPMELVKKVELNFKVGGKKRYKNVVKKASLENIFYVPVPGVYYGTKPKKIEYFVRCLNSYDGILFEKGDPLYPLSVEVMPSVLMKNKIKKSKNHNLLKSIPGWLWWGMGSLVVGATVGYFVHDYYSHRVKVDVNVE